MSTSIDSRLAELKSRLERKASFEAAARDFAALLDGADSSTLKVWRMLVYSGRQSRTGMKQLTERRRIAHHIYEPCLSELHA